MTHRKPLPIHFSYCTAEKPTPVLNTPEFHKIFGGENLPLDDKGLLRAVEMIALPGTKFKILGKISDYVFQVTTSDYPHGPQYIDRRFVKIASETTPERKKNIPPLQEICKKLEDCLGTAYIWGGNWSKGIPEIRKFYKNDIPPDQKKNWILSGVDCSGLLYEATRGFTPRNTSELLQFGEVVPTLANVKPLDILIFPGHVLIFLTPTIFIESLYGHGVIKTPVNVRLSKLPKQHIIRRFLN